jgi:hypothetical protein
MVVERGFAVEAVADAAEYLSDYSMGDSRGGDDLDDLSVAASGSVGGFSE